MQGIALVRGFWQETVARGSEEILDALRKIGDE
jgi:hypothetical protein